VSPASGGLLRRICGWYNNIDVDMSMDFTIEFYETEIKPAGEE